MERRINSRINSDFAARARREFWAHKQAESLATSESERKADINLVNNWLVRFTMAQQAVK